MKSEIWSFFYYAKNLAICGIYFWRILLNTRISQQTLLRMFFIKVTLAAELQFL